VDIKDVKCGSCKFASKEDTPICINPNSVNYGIEVAETDYCIMGFELNKK
jgi:hypothetical protein